ncbi:MAG: hypothetical protein KDK91_14840 [Gammaproteobacteria bacterium]|nr:hypothetical protein [Gammaproteobacteria bacterium]
MTMAVVIVFLASAFGAWVWHEQVTRSLVEQKAGWEEQAERLRASREDLQERHTALKERLAVLERGAQVKEQAYARVDEHLKNLQSRVAELGEELAFYKGIVTKDAPKSLRLGSVRISQESDSQYLLNVVLTRGMRSDKVIEGKVSIEILGNLAGVPRRLSMSELTPSGRDGVSFRVRHFQRVSQRLVLPQGFTAQDLTVQIKTVGAKPTVLENTYAWSGVMD